MRTTVLLAGGAAVVLLGSLGFVAWILSLPSSAAAAAPAPVPREEADAMLAALAHAGDSRPLIAVIGINDATETNDYLTPTGILRRADVADVVMLATGPGPVQLYPVLRVLPDATLADFDAAHPKGADYVIVPAMSRDDDPAVRSWLQDQSLKGARIIAVCAGAKVAAAAGLLDGRRATTHWYYLRELLRRSPTTVYVPDRRMVQDGKVATTTGITAAVPMMLTLIEAIAGRTRAEKVARDLGLGAWDARHASAAFKLTRPFAMTVLANRLAFWSHEDLGIGLTPGADEVSLALVADAWSRTYRSSVSTFPASAEVVVTANGVRLLPDRVGTELPGDRRVSSYPDRRPAQALDDVLRAIAERYGERTTRVVSMQLEYPRSGEVR